MSNGWAQCTLFDRDIISAFMPFKGAVNVQKGSDSARERRGPAMALASFDLDKTLLPVNSGTLWVKRELRLAFLTARQAVQVTWWLTRYSMGLANGTEMVGSVVADSKEHRSTRSQRERGPCMRRHRGDVTGLER
jgi:hypothetical protein